MREFEVFSSVVAASTNRYPYTYLYACRQRLIWGGEKGGWGGVSFSIP